MESEKIVEVIKAVVPTEKVYDDIASPALKETGGVLVSVIKTAKIAFLPLEFTAHVYDKLAGHLKRIFDPVPEDRQIEPPTEISGPVLEGLKYAAEGSLLEGMFENLLARAIDSERADEAHPAFTMIIKQLAPDEALLLYHFRNHPHKELPELTPMMPTKLMKLPDVYQQVPDVPFHLLDFEANGPMYLSHLRQLELISTDSIPQVFSVDGESTTGAEQRQVDLKIWRLTAFGKMFASACIPNDFPEEEAD